MPPRFFRTLTPAVALLLAPLPPAVALEKCVGPDGRISYSQHACPQGSRTSTIAGSPAGGSSGGVSSTPVRIEYFDVQGGDYNALLASLNARGRFHARADWKLTYRYQSVAAAAGCSVGELTTTLELTMTLPRWRPPAGASRELMGRWERYMGALRSHEEGHLQHGREFEREFRRAAATLADRSCDSLQARVRALFGEMLARYQSRDKLYDEQTGHGRTQGAVFQ